MNWYIGQPIVAIKNHPQGAFTKGQEFVIKSLRTSSCKCNEIEIDIGMTEEVAHTLSRSGCGQVVLDKRSTWWFSDKRFAPLDTDISELTELLTQKQVI